MAGGALPLSLNVHSACPVNCSPDDSGTALASAYNNALFNGLAASGLSVIPLDTFHFLQEVVANPAEFGLANVTGTACNLTLTGGSSSTSCAATSRPACSKRTRRSSLNGSSFARTCRVA